jgi:hypothetical protein
MASADISSEIKLSSLPMQIALVSVKGLLVVAVSPRPSKGEIRKSVWGFETFPQSEHPNFGLSREGIVPDFILIVLAAALGALPWIRWRFSYVGACQVMMGFTC